MGIGGMTDRKTGGDCWISYTINRCAKCSTTEGYRVQNVRTFIQSVGGKVSGSIPRRPLAGILF